MVKTFDIVDAVVQNKADELSGEYVINDESLDILSQYCDVIDNILEECFGDQITADVIDNNLVVIEIVLSSFVYESRFKPRSYLSIIERAICVDFSRVRPDKVSMKFVFPSVFNKK